MTVCKTKLRTIEKLRVKNGILLTMNPTEHTGWIVVDAGRMIKAQISADTIARAVTPLQKRRNIRCALLSSGLPNMTPVKKKISKKGPWLNDMCQHEQQYDTNSDQDEEALHDPSRQT